MDSRGSRMCSHDSLTDSHDSPTYSHGLPMYSHGLPTCSRGSPMYSHDSPTCSRGSPTYSHGPRSCSHGLPCCYYATAPNAERNRGMGRSHGMARSTSEPTRSCADPTPAQEPQDTPTTLPTFAASSHFSKFDSLPPPDHQTFLTPIHSLKTTAAPHLR